MSQENLEKKWKYLDGMGGLIIGERPIETDNDIKPKKENSKLQKEKRSSKSTAK